MIARRFRALGWVAGIASAATGLYLISLQVAAERAKLEDVDRRIAAAHREIWQLQTELGTRASMRQLERWNDDVLALAAPRAGQYLQGAAQLASLSRDIPSTLPAASVPHAVLVAATPQAILATAPRVVKAIVTAAAPRIDNARLQRAAYVAAPPVLGERIAMVDSMVERTVINRRTFGELLRAAAAESRKQP